MKYLQHIFEIIGYIDPRAASGGDILKRPASRILSTLEGIQKQIRKKESGESDGFTLESIYTVLSGYLATNPRDRIFALLGLADPDSYGSCILPDYSVPTWDVYVHATGKMVKYSKHFPLLSHARTASKRSQYGGQDLPT